MPTLRYAPGIIEKIIKKLNVTTYNTLKTEIAGAANYAVGAGKQEAHVVTGHMKRNIQQQGVSDTHIRVLSKAIYSGYENARGEPHNFFDKMYERTKTRFNGQIIIGKIQETMRSGTL